MELSWSEIEAAKVVSEQTDEQLLFTFDQFFYDDGKFDFVDYMVVPQNRYAFPVKKDYFVSIVMEELCYRNLI